MRLHLILGSGLQSLKTTHTLIEFMKRAFFLFQLDRSDRRDIEESGLNLFRLKVKFNFVL